MPAKTFQGVIKRGAHVEEAKTERIGYIVSIEGRRWAMVKFREGRQLVPVSKLTPIPTPKQLASERRKLRRKHGPPLVVTLD